MAASAERPSDVLSPAIDKLDTGKPASSSPLLQRIASALFLIPIIVAAIYAGGLYFAAAVAFATIVMIFEWTRMVERRDFTGSFYALALGGGVCLIAAVLGAYELAFVFGALSGLAAFYLGKRSRSGLGFWPAIAAPYILFPSIALIWLRMEVDNARGLTFFLFLAVWAADSGAFFFGKFLGGPKISYALSPSKTWAGIAGGIIGGGVIAVVARPLTGVDELWSSLALGGVLGAMSVLGDLAESGLKRNFGLKDISGFIPGHGGALDRLDGMIFATIAMTGLLFFDIMP